MACCPGGGVNLRPRRALFVAAILTGSFLLFLVQPMIARMALPRLGGAPAVWNSAMLVYQLLLLAGYGYAHWLSRWPLRRQAAIHLTLLLGAAMTLPVGLVTLPPVPAGGEVFWVPVLLALSIGPVFFLVSAQAPLLQRWFAADPAAPEPWALYAASNLGSFGGLLAYPLLAEPLLSLHWQSRAWTIGYLGLILRGLADPGPASDPHEHPAQRPSRQVMLLWLALGAVPSGLMLSTTTHLTTDLFAMPLLWVIPLGLYLLSFVIAFAQRRGPARIIGALAWPVVLGAGGLAMVSQGSNGLLPVLASLGLLFFVCTALHSRLYDSRPDAGNLTFFYLVMASGGALGGAIPALVAPLVFDWSWEHPLLVLAALLLLPRDRLPDWRRMPGLDDAMVRLALGTILVCAGLLTWKLAQFAWAADAGLLRWSASLILVLCGLACARPRALAAAILLATMVAQGGFQTIRDSWDGIRSRSYFGIYTVRTFEQARLRTLTHGSTLHGEQWIEPGLRDVPLTYYGPTSGAGIVFTAVTGMFGPHARIGVVGLGTGTLACFARDDQNWRFFEIDPLVDELSRRGTFTFLRDCAPQAQVTIGDARLELAKVAPGSFDLLAIDAFSSDSIPLHLSTDEALATYLRALSPRGVLLVHISNRYIDLEPVLAAAARKRGLAAALRDDLPPTDGEYTASVWVALSRDPARLEEIAASEPESPWRPLKKPAPAIWTDDHASILPYERWRNLIGRPQ